MIYPDTIFSGLWQVLISIVLLISVFITPFNLAFENYSTFPRYALFLNVIDALFYVDIFLNFFMVIDKEDGTFIDDRKELVMMYMKGWFSIDFAAVFPFDVLITLIMKAGNSG